MANLFIRPGAILIFLIALAIGMGVFNWSESLLEATGQRSETGSEAIECSTLDVNYPSQDNNGTHHTVYVELNKPVEAIAVTFEGSSDNRTRVIEDPGSISKATAPISPVSGIKTTIKGCSREFRD